MLAVQQLMHHKSTVPHEGGAGDGCLICHRSQNYSARCIDGGSRDACPPAYLDGAQAQCRAGMVGESFHALTQFPAPDGGAIEQYIVIHDKPQIS